MTDQESAEVQRLRLDNAGAAALHLAFRAAAEEAFAIGKHLGGDKATKADKMWMGVWGKLYNVVQGSEAGLGVLKELAELKADRGA